MLLKVEEGVGAARSDQLAYGDCDNTQRPERFETLAPSPTVGRVAVMATGSDASLEKIERSGIARLTVSH